MICRSRPKYLESEIAFNKSDMDMDCYIKQRLWFQSGKQATEFFIRCYNEYFHKKAYVGIQSFTCRTMLDAICEADSVACVYDVSLEDVSIDFELIKNDQLDIIIVTSYQGIPNKNYVKMAQYCNENNIILFEDLAHGRESTIAGVTIGSLGNVCMESFCWDKPYSVLHGGTIDIKNLPDDFMSYIQNSYKKLKLESSKQSKTDIELQSFLINYTKPENYYNDFDYMFFVQGMFLRYLYNKKLFNHKCYRKFLVIIFKIYRRLKVTSIDNKITALNDEKKLLIYGQYCNYKNNGNNQTNYIKSIKDILKDCKGINYFDDNGIVWNRYSVIDKSGEAKYIFNNMGIEADTYNWRNCLHDMENDYKNRMIVRSECPNSEFLAKHIINIPLWIDLKTQYFD